MKRFSVLLVAILLFSACQKDSSTTQTTTNPTEPVEVKLQSITLDNTSLSLKIGDTHQLQATLLPTNASNKVIAYSSSDTTIAKVSTSGLIKAVKAGTSIISVTNVKSGIVTQCTVTVPPVVVSSITIKTETITFYLIGNTYQLAATVLPTNAANAKIAWYSSDPTKVSVSSDGFITTIAYGSAIITAKSTDGSNVTSPNCTVIVTK